NSHVQPEAKGRRERDPEPDPCPQAGIQRARSAHLLVSMALRDEGRQLELLVQIQKESIAGPTVNQSEPAAEPSPRNMPRPQIGLGPKSSFEKEARPPISLLFSQYRFDHPARNRAGRPRFHRGSTFEVPG